MKKPLYSKTDFSLIETILWESGSYFLLALHMKRLKRSAEHFSFSCDESRIKKALEKSASSFSSSEKYRMRLLLDKSGNINLESNVLVPLRISPVKITITDKRVDRNDVFLRHKTTNRSLYDEELEKFRTEGFFDILFMNQDGEITEGAITNIIIRNDASYFTPPVSCGLLPGVYREFLFKEGKLPLKEKVLYPKDVLEADGVFTVNSIRKMVPAILI